MFLITRIKNLKDKKEIEYFLKWLKRFERFKDDNKNHNEIRKIFIISDRESKKKLLKKLNKSAPLSKKIKFLTDQDPTSPISMNMAIEKFDKEKLKPKGFIIASKEAKIQEGHIKKLISEILKSGKNNKILCVGYKFKIIGVNHRLNKKLKDYYNKKLLAYRVPWNTCIIWNYSLFKEYIENFDEICNKKPFGKLNVCIDDVVEETECKGMEDGLAIAKAASNKEVNIKFKLLDKYLDWEWKIKKEEILKNRKKLARKNKVLLNFMAIRGYSVYDLLKAET